MKSTLSAASPLAAALAWVGALIIDSDPYDPLAAMLIGIGLVVPASVSVVGMVAAGGRWAHRTALFSLGAAFVLASARPVDAAWMVALAATTTSLALLLTPMVTSRIRKLPAAAGPPEKAVVLSLLLLAAPFSLGIAAPDGADWKHVLVALAALVAAFMYSRVIPGGLLAVRVGWPAVALGLAYPLGLWEGVISGLMGGLVVLVAWDPAIKVAFHSPRETGSTFPIPPELAPREILDAAQIDDRGRKL